MGTLRLQLDNELIKTMYIEKLFSVKEIADELGVNRYTVAKRIRLMNILRNRSESNAATFARGRKPAMLKATNEQIRHLFVDEKLSPWAIAKKLGYRNSSNILVRLHRMKLISAPFENHPFAENHYHYQGGTWKDGYIRVYKPEYYRATSRGYVLEHILVWETYHNRRLPAGYLIHHLNGIKNDNRPSNLIAMKKNEHVHQAEPFKKKILELEIENEQLKNALRCSVLFIGSN